MNEKEKIINGKTALGIELGSTRIKGVLIDGQGNVLATGTYDWENSWINNIWTYSLDEIHTGIRNCYSSLRKAVEEKYGITLRTIGAIGVSAMMHGYMALNKDGKQIAPFQTWRNMKQRKGNCLRSYTQILFQETMIAEDFWHTDIIRERILQC